VGVGVMLRFGSCEAGVCEIRVMGEGTRVLVVRE